ncbi:hypothetical protein GKR59_16495 [Providencia alcalifaciens]|uniref:hypothetical protein n=1 Tax=Providencia TaxID=586 RepID=UPI0012B53AF3|nr:MULTISPECIES: hypothetical protein [Providencia]MTC51221.1 hypothetical protein [Providencia alcalifaciens]
MSSRGIFSLLSSNQAYQNAEKEWHIELDFYYKYWYDLVARPTDMLEHVDTKRSIVSFLKNLKNEIEEKLEKRFVYFICSRERVRFNIKKKSSYNPFTGNKKIHILIGEKEYKKNIKCKFFDEETKKHYNPEIYLRDKYITIKFLNGNSCTMTIHDFLEATNINLGIDSKVEYVGFTKNPDTRPTNGAHSGLNDVIYNVIDEKKDSFIYFNIFKVYSKADNSTHNLNFVFANSMIDEVNVDMEGSILEKCFILYFNSDNQYRNKNKEYDELRSSLVKLAKENKINSINIHYALSDNNEYEVFSSSKVQPNHEHFFTIKNGIDGLSIEKR